MGSGDELHKELLRRARDAVDAVVEAVADSLALTYISTELCDAGIITRCAWCSRYRVEDRWVQLRTIVLVFDGKTSHGICDDCVQGLRATGLSR